MDDLEAVERQLLRALQRGDVSASESLLRDDFLITTAGWLPEPVGKRAWLKGLTGRNAAEPDAPARHSRPSRWLARGRLRTRPVVDPSPLWCWSLVTRANDERDSIAVLRDHAVTVMQPAAQPTTPAGPIWLPAADPHRDHVRSLE